MEKPHTLNKVQWGFLVAHAWSEASFRKQLEADPAGTIKSFAKQQFGLDIAHDIALPMDLPLPPADLGVEDLTLGMSLSAAPGTGTGCGTASGTATAGEVRRDAKSN